MSAAVPIEFFSDRPWTEADFLALPDSRSRIELLDSELLVSPAAGSPHQRMSFRFCIVLERARPDGLEVLEAVNVRVDPGTILIPDLVVVRRPGTGTVVWDAVDVLMVVEIVSPGSARADRAVKPQLYAAAGIAHYLRIELGASGTGPSAVGYELRDGRYVEVVRADPGERLRLASPFPVDVDLGELFAADRPPLG